MSIIMVIVIAVSLSMDAFSLSLAYGTLNLEKSQIRLLSLIVGLYHFFMPLLGMWVGTKILNFVEQLSKKEGLEVLIVFQLE